VTVFLSPFENTNQPLSGNLFFHFIALSRKGDLEMDKYKLVKFTDEGFELDVRTDAESETVWLSQKEMSLLFDVSTDNIGLHINNILREKELDYSTTEESSVVQIEGNRKITRHIKIYNLDMIISVGYRVKSRRGIIFRRWANRVLKDYLIQGYAANEKRLNTLNKTIDIQTKMLAYSLDIDKEELSKVINEYTRALDLLDGYDHQTLEKPKVTGASYTMSYEEARGIIDSMKFSNMSEVFGVEKEEGKLNGIIAQIDQNVFGQELYPSIEEKAAHLLYFLVKDHPFADGCKRIAATLFINYLYKNNYLYRNNKQIISNEALVAITILTAESNPSDMDIIVKLIMNLLVS